LELLPEEDELEDELEDESEDDLEDELPLFELLPELVFLLHPVSVRKTISASPKYLARDESALFMCDLLNRFIKPASSIKIEVRTLFLGAL